MESLRETTLARLQDQIDRIEAMSDPGTALSFDDARAWVIAALSEASEWLAWQDDRPPRAD